MPEQIEFHRSKGWRWRLPWSDPRDNKLPMVMFLVAVAFVAYFFLNLPAGTSPWVVAGACVFAFGAGGMLVMWLRD